MSRTRTWRPVVNAPVSAKRASYVTVICREPFRLFFPMGIVCGMIGAAHWLVYALGWSSAYSGLFHASVQMQAYMTCFVLGFLMTALPRFSGTQTATRLEVGMVVALMTAQVLFLIMGRWVAAESCFAALLLWLVLFAGRRVIGQRRSTPPPPEFVWIPFALLHGLLGTGLLIGGQLEWLPRWALTVGRPLLQQGFLLSLVLGVGGFLGARLLGHGVPPTSTDGTEGMLALTRWRRQRLSWHLVTGAVLLLSFWLERLIPSAWAYGIRAVVVTLSLRMTVLFPRWPRLKELYLWWLWLSFGCVIAGCWAAALFPTYRVAMLHGVFLGGFSLMTFAIATMVTLSHTGEGARLRQPLPVLWIVGGAVLAALGCRLAAVFMPHIYFALLGLGAACWLVAGVSWLACIGPFLARVPAAEQAFDRLHEQAKQRLRCAPGASTTYDAG